MLVFTFALFYFYVRESLILLFLPARVEIQIVLVSVHAVRLDEARRAQSSSRSCPGVRIRFGSSADKLQVLCRFFNSNSRKKATVQFSLFFFFLLPKSAQVDKVNQSASKRTETRQSSRTRPPRRQQLPSRLFVSFLFEIKYI